MGEKYHLGNLHHVKTPHLSRRKYTSEECPPEGKELDKMTYPYLSLLMTVAWIAIHCRVELMMIHSSFDQVLRVQWENQGAGIEEWPFGQCGPVHLLNCHRRRKLVWVTMLLS
jgi:hypothetical protein